MENPKEAMEEFQEEMDSLNYQIGLIKNSLNSVASFLEREATNKKYNQGHINSLAIQIQELKQEISEIKQKLVQNQTPAHLQHISGTTVTSKSGEKNEELKKGEFGHLSHVSIGNEGVPALRQQSDNNQTTIRQQSKSEKKEDIAKIANLYKEDFKQDFQKLTKQEREVFYHLYSLNNKHPIVDYSLLSSTINLTTSSIRDYISRLIRKKMPIEKKRINNRKIVLKISQNFKNLVKLDSLLNLIKEDQISFKERLNEEFNQNLLDSGDLGDFESSEDI